jgi:hypothetical protein
MGESFMEKDLVKIAAGPTPVAGRSCDGCYFRIVGRGA